MSITPILESEEFEEIIEEFDKPVLESKPIIHHPSKNYQGMEYALIGTAVDYLIRFKLQKETPASKVYSSKLVAENIKLHPESQRSIGEVHEKAEELLEEGKETDIMEAINAVEEGKYPEEGSLNMYLKEAKEGINEYIKSDGQLPLSETIDMARIDHIWRGNQMWIKEYLGEEDEKYNQDLENLLDISHPVFEVEEYTVLNPTLGLSESHKIGADADLIIDDVLIDIKTTLNPEFTMKQFKQLIIYLTLLDIHTEKENTLSSGWEAKKPEKFGIYYTRSSNINLLNTSIIYDNEKYSKIKKFIENFDTS